MGEPGAVIRREFAPIIIGISGASNLEGEDAVVRVSLKAIFDRLDGKYPSSPKLLLTMLASGADLLGAEDVVNREGWEVVAVLPLPLDIYLTGFDQSAAATTGLNANILSASAWLKANGFSDNDMASDLELAKRLVLKQVALPPDALRRQLAGFASTTPLPSSR